MNIFPKDRGKRNQMIIVIAATLALLGLIGFALIRPQRETLSRIAKTRKTAQAKLQLTRNTIKKAEETALQLSDTTSNLVHAEEDVASGDVFAWLYDTIRRFKTPYRVDIPNIGQPSISEADVLQKFPYKQIKVNVSGTAYYHDLGKFIADLENTFPHIRVVNLTIESANTSWGGNEKLSFRMDVVALVKSNS